MRAQSALARSLIRQRNKALCQLGYQIALFFRDLLPHLQFDLQETLQSSPILFDKSLSSFLSYGVKSQNSNPQKTQRRLDPSARCCSLLPAFRNHHPQASIGTAAIGAEPRG